MAAVKPIPEGYESVVPYICVRGGAEAIEFYKRAFGAVEVMRMAQPDGRIGHAEVKIGSGHVMLADEFTDIGFRSPQSLGGSPVLLHLYVEDVDSFVERAVSAGATLTRPVEDQFYGDRLGQVTDPFGHSWSFATRIEEVGPEEVAQRAKEAGG